MALAKAIRLRLGNCCVTYESIVPNRQFSALTDEAIAVLEGVGQGRH
jgi:hypothetical protein